MKTSKAILLLFFAALLFTSCVSSKKFQELQSNHKNCLEENSLMKSKNLEYSTKINELTSANDRLKKQNERLLSDSSITGANLRELTKKYDDLSAAYDTLLDNNLKLMKGNKYETQKLISELEKTKEILQKKEDELKKLENELNTKLSKLNEMQATLDEKQQKLHELQSILDKKDSAVNALKNKVSEALLGYENKGLTIKQKNGKVYVSMDESLLFASGKYEVSAKGTDALKKLAKVLETNTDINIMVEGHTDNVPYKGTDQILDNWDLSVKRATTVVRILVSGSKIAPVRITAAGRSEYYPVDAVNSSEARSKNRRTEIILTPKLDELFKIIESN
ncbi:MAG: OmpA family protein [Bacteroidales bacterium]|jgi:chemotaxis protein MotB|nr:OmpA family protein [Bacteroidales bacterium]MDD4213306.1 OmpA family protein [Bacteroidales bacterium]